jgi:catechol 2,3-dioxygenase-like lactoylglutathione lyase family enzyme
VADLDDALVSLRTAGVRFSSTTGLSGRPTALIAAPDGVVVELTEGESDSPGALFSGIRIAAIDASATRDFLCAIGFDEVHSDRVQVSAAQLAPGGGSADVECVVARYALPEDADRFTLTVVAHPATNPDPVPWGGNRQGLYRCALRVENVGSALHHTPGFVERRGEPVWCPLPGTKIEGLTIAFLRSPDGVVFEFVERPLRFF